MIKCLFHGMFLQFGTSTFVYWSFETVEFAIACYMIIIWDSFATYSVYLVSHSILICLEGWIQHRQVSRLAAICQVPIIIETYNRIFMIVLISVAS